MDAPSGDGPLTSANALKITGRQEVREPLEERPDVLPGLLVNDEVVSPARVGVSRSTVEI